jgi:flagellar hook assembly protein FlgD
MKTSVAIISLFLLSTLGSMAAAPTKATLENCSLTSLKSAVLKTTKDRTFRFIMKNEEDSPVTIHLKDEIGQVLYMKKLKKAGDFATDFNFTNMPNGKYTIEMVKKNCISRQQLTL